MYIYLNNSEEMRSNLSFEGGPNKDASILELNKTFVHVFSPCNFPYAKTMETDFEAILRNDCLNHYFLKAVDITFPKFPEPREYGVYFFANAKAELRPHKDGVCMKIETDSFRTIRHMVELQEEIYAGTIRPSVSYEKKQATRIKIYLSMLRRKIFNFFKKIKNT